MHSISLDKLASLIKGEILIKANIHKIPLKASRSSDGVFQSIAFLDKPFQSEPEFMNQLKTHDVCCLITDSSCSLSSNKCKSAGVAVIQVKNVPRAYRILAKFYRTKFSIPFIQVIGSSGKSTTTEMIGSVLNQEFPALFTLDNTNSPNGVAFNLFRLKRNHRAAVLEAGMKAPGIMRITSKSIKPDIAVVTSIHRAHFTRLGSIQKIIAAKAEILESLSPKGTLIINWADPNCHKFPLSTYKGKILRYGFTNKCDLWASNIERHGVYTMFMVHISSLHFPCMINIIGNYNVGNALAAVAVGLTLGINPAQIIRGLKHFKPIEGRLKVHPQRNGAIIIDDNFNANPDSTRMLVDELIQMSMEQPLVLVIGDMERPSRDIEKYARKVHFDIGCQIAQGRFQHVMAIGVWAGEYVRGAIQKGFPRDKLSYYPNVALAQKEFNALLTSGTTVVLKASPYTPLNYLRLNAFIG